MHANNVQITKPAISAGILFNIILFKESCVISGDFCIFGLHFRGAFASLKRV